MIDHFELIDGVCGVASYQHLYLTAWWDEATVPRLSQLREHRKRFLAAHEGAVFSFAMLYQNKLKIMSAESRRLVEEINRDAGGRFAAEAYYVKGGGLLISSMRFLLAGLRLVNRLKTPLEVFGDLPTSVQWLSTQSSLPIEGLQAAVDAFVAECNPR